MLPNTALIEDIDKLILEFEEAQQGKTKTFAIDEDLVESEGSANDDSLSILGVGRLGVLKLNTYKIQTIKEPLNIISGEVDGLEALKQSIYLMLSVEADQYIIYPYTYGIQTLDLIGKPSYYVMAVIPDRITEALLRDDRITDVSDFEFDINGNKLTVKFVVHSIYGEVNEETVVVY